MANLFQTATSGLASLKNYYQGPIVDQFNEEVPVYRAAEKVKQGWSGQQVIRPIRSRRNQGVGATTDGGNLPTIGRQTTLQAIIAAKYNYLRFGITGPMIKASQSDAGSFVRAAAYELEMGYKDLKSDCNRQLSWNGDGTLATVSAAVTASTTLALTGREAAEPALKFLDIGTAVDIYSSSTLQASNVTIASISAGTASSSTATIVLDSAVTVSASAVLVRAGSGLTSEMQGLLTGLDGGTTTIYNIDRSTVLSFQGNSRSTVETLSLNGMQTIYNEGLRRGGAKYNAVWCDFDSIRMYQKLLTADKRYTNTTKADGTFGNKDEFYMDFNGIPVVPDKDCPQRFFFLPAEVFKMYVLSEMEFSDESGSMYIAQTSADSFEVRVRFFANLFNEQPSACAILSGYLAP